MSLVYLLRPDLFGKDSELYPDKQAAETQVEETVDYILDAVYEEYAVTTRRY